MRVDHPAQDQRLQHVRRAVVVLAVDEDRLTERRGEMGMLRAGGEQVRHLQMEEVMDADRIQHGLEIAPQRATESGGQLGGARPLQP